MKNFDKDTYVVAEPKLDATGEVVKDADGYMVMEDATYSRAERLNRDLQFAIGGEEFAFRPAVRPEDVLRWHKLGVGELPPEERTEEGIIGILDETVRAFLEPGQEDKWERVRSADAAHPITGKDLRGLVRWLFEETSGRPTKPPPRSSSGSSTDETGTGSTAKSSSLAEVASTA